MTEPAVKKIKKSDRTRAAIADAARDEFGRNGFERATIRDIAARAGVDPALIIRYFGNKDQLFARVAEFDLRLPDLGVVPRSKIGEVLAAHYVSVWEDNTLGMAILLRSATSNDLAAAHMRQIFVTQVLPTIMRISDPQSAPIRASLIASQLLGLALCRYLLKMPPLVAMPREALVRYIGRTIQHYVTDD